MFQWDSTRERFLAPLQREREEARVAAATQLHHEEKVYLIVTIINLIVTIINLIVTVINGSHFSNSVYAE